MLNTYCMECIENAVKKVCTTPCVGYEHEVGHYPRMVTECKWLASIVQDLFRNHLPNVKAELIKRA